MLMTLSDAPLRLVFRLIIPIIEAQSDAAPEM